MTDEAGKVRVESAVVAKRVIDVEKGKETAKLQVYAIRTSARLRDNKKSTGELIAIHDPQSGLFLWKFNQIDPRRGDEAIQNFLKEATLLLSNEKIISVAFASPPPTLWISESSERHKTFEQATGHAISWLTNSYERGKFRKAPFVERRIDLMEVLGREFFYKKNTAALPRARITKISRVGSDVKIQLQGPNDDEAEIIFDATFKAKTAKLRGESVFPKKPDYK